MAESIAVLGGGSWGTALAWLLGGKGYEVRLCCRNAQHAAEIRREQRNLRYLPDLPLPDSVAAMTIEPAALAGVRLWVVAVPLQRLRGLVEQVSPDLPPRCDVVIAAKGLEVGTGLRGSEIVREVSRRRLGSRLAVLSGPNLAAELVRGVPSTTVIASQNASLGRRVQQTFGTSFFRVYTNQDVTGVEFGGALKNPVAIAAGISDGLGFGDNTKAALITRGLAEMTRLGTAAGGQAATFAGISGLGDLVATCSSPLSRNHRLGRALGRGTSLTRALEEIGQVAEGVPTTQAAVALAERLGVEVPITAELAKVLFHGKPPLEAVTGLMNREFRDECGDLAPLRGRS